MTKIILLRHADTQKDSSAHSSKWLLSKEGQKQSQDLLDNELLQDVDIIVTSTEEKARLTVEPLAKKLGLEPTANDDFSEVRRGDKFLSNEDFEREKEKQLTDLDYKAFNGELGNEAFIRFNETLEELVSLNPNKTILITTHGTILNIYLAKRFDKLGQIVERWHKTPFCGYAIIEDGQLIKDIV